MPWHSHRKSSNSWRRSCMLPCRIRSAGLGSGGCPPVAPQPPHSPLSWGTCQLPAGCSSQEPPAHLCRHTGRRSCVTVSSCGKPLPVPRKGSPWWDRLLSLQWGETKLLGKHGVSTDWVTVPLLGWLALLPCTMLSPISVPRNAQKRKSRFYRERFLCWRSSWPSWRSAAPRRREKSWGTF